ncbi:MAG: class I SAM-dependent methyltransferase [Gammaproteobacteria bacterium]|nr:class I SAM-dependent methyltransferase [Gammaproteobacteria bacterium]MBU1654544.1 class I SAM-dependent methyltransferase [Gammaproteobacteria bacterium]MBU1961936.1 class I SAM-dependent methyltransferase [Gammaproteobacteria bacterium]
MSNGYLREDWDDYAMAFQGIMPSMMLQLNQAVADRMGGDVIDFGCGAAKIAPFILEKTSVRSYTGLDYAPEMVTRARWMLAQFPGKPCVILEGKIEEARLGCHDSALSINSYYAWENPLRALSCIFRALRENGTFVLATPNPLIDMPALLKASERELIAHPYWQRFREQNLAFCGNGTARFIEMDELIAQVRSVGFRVAEAHQKLYMGGLNFLHLEK